MNWQRLLKDVLKLFEYLYQQKWGYLVLSTSVTILVALLGLAQGNITNREIAVLALTYGQVITGGGYLVRKYGWQGSAEKVVTFTITIVLFLGKLVIVPVSFILGALFGPPKRLFFHRIPNALPVVLQPAYWFIWLVIGCSATYGLFLWLEQQSPNPKDWGSITVFQTSYPVLIQPMSSILLIGGIVSVLLALWYVAILWEWLGKLKWKMKFIIRV